MNITDFRPGEKPKTLAAVIILIFDCQRSLMAQYKAIEQLPSAPVSVHHAAGQRVIKDFAWRTVEELTESYEAWEKHADDHVTAEQHALEELADAVHFFVELLIFAGITAEQCYLRYAKLQAASESAVLRGLPYWRATYHIGLAMNFLRNKPWKQSQVPTDEARFRAALLDAWAALMQLWEKLGYDDTALYSFYFRKFQVNQFRQRSNY